MNLRTTPLSPDLLPLPAPGKHLHPADGACLMEAASLLAGEPFGDHPRCVHPTIAALARLLNDATTAAGRDALWRLLPGVIGGPAHDPRIAPMVVLHVLTVADAQCGIGNAGRLARRRAARRLALLGRGGLRARWVRASDPVYRRAPAERALARAVDRMAYAMPVASIDLTAPRLLARCLQLAAAAPARPVDDRSSGAGWGDANAQPGAGRRAGAAPGPP